MSVAIERERVDSLRRLALILSLALFAKVFLSIVYEYRNYFPANFDSNFLFGRREYFFGTYGVAFYAHIVGGPIAILLGAFLVFSGVRSRFRGLHRVLGRIQIAIVLLLVVPGGLVMAARASAGPIAGAGFAGLGVATAVTAAMTLHSARSRRFVAHRRWAIRFFILLCSPLLLRIMSGAMISFQYDSDVTYRWIAWLSWLLPLAVHEAWLRGSFAGVFGMQKRFIQNPIGSPR